MEVTMRDFLGYVENKDIVNLFVSTWSAAGGVSFKMVDCDVTIDSTSIVFMADQDQTLNIFLDSDVRFEDDCVWVFENTQSSITCRFE